MIGFFLYIFLRKFLRQHYGMYEHVCTETVDRNMRPRLFRVPRSSPTSVCKVCKSIDKHACEQCSLYGFGASYIQCVKITPQKICTGESLPLLKK